MSERHQQLGMGGGEADAVDEQVGTVAERGLQLRLVVPIGGDEPRPCGGKPGRHPGRVPAGHVDLPPRRQHPLGNSAADQAATAEYEGARHPSTLCGSAAQTPLEQHRWRNDVPGGTSSGT
jgi:hypothetical protein